MINVGFGDDGGQILFSPVLGGHILLEDHHLLELHFLELLGVLEDDGCEDVQAEGEVVALVGEVGVEEPQARFH